jgi:hypothetical protein
MRLVKESMERGHEAWKYGSLEPWRVLQAQEREEEGDDGEEVCLMDQVYSKYSMVGRAKRSIARGLDVIDSLGIKFKLPFVRLEK